MHPVSIEDSERLRRLQDTFGPSGGLDVEAAPHMAVADVAPAAVLRPDTMQNVVDCLVAAHEQELSLVPVGNGTQLQLGRAPLRYDAALSLRGLRRVVAHEAADMTVTVEAGCTLAELNARLGQAGQWLPLDPPCPQNVTIGGLISTDASGPSRLAHGKVRDLLIGVTAVLADGRTVHGGGRVVKNVAGYDLMKLLTGSLGTLAVITEATFKVRPRPERNAVLLCPQANLELAMTRALELLSAPIAPIYLSVVNAAAAGLLDLDGPHLCIGLGGGTEEIEIQYARVVKLQSGQLVSRLDEIDADRLHAGLRDLPSRDTVLSFRLSLLPSAMSGVIAQLEERAASDDLQLSLVAHVGSGAATVGCHSGDDHYDWAALGTWLRARSERAGGYVVFNRIPNDVRPHLDPWGESIPGLALMRSIKSQLDPRYILSPGRFVGGI